MRTASQGLCNKISDTMKFVALLSGGKDSCFNILKCIENGHELACLGNLYPADVQQDETNSWMYQTAGHAIIPAMAECIGVPLYRQPINGETKLSCLDYVETEDDEVEDLYLLLKTVIRSHPDVKGVSCGAIVSTYQRLRVENVCLRLGLTCLSYMWQRDRQELLPEIINSGIYAVLVKVAGAGLDPSKHLGKDLATLHPALIRLHQRFGLDVCGEGGEYESMVLDAPFFRKKLLIDKSDIAYDAEDVSVGNLRILSWQIVEKDSSDCNSEMRAEPSSPLESWIDDMAQRYTEAAAGQSSEDVSDVCSSRILALDLRDAQNCPPTAKNVPSEDIVHDGVSTFGRSGDVCPYQVGLDGLIYSALMYPTPSNLAATNNDSYGILAQGQLREIFAKIEHHQVIAMHDIAFVKVYLAEMSLFGFVNEEYCKYFSSKAPSRCCVALPLPHGVAVAIEIVCLRGSGKGCERTDDRKVLHVRSMSDWAPLCIGPYSQANSLNDAVVLVAGQIPLVPATMSVYEWNNENGLSSVEGLSGVTISNQGDVLQADISSDTNADKNGNMIAARKALDTYWNNTWNDMVRQLILSLRHANRVLTVSHGSLKQSLYCTVYVNAGLISNVVSTLTNSSSDDCYDYTAKRIPWARIQRLVSKLLANDCEEAIKDDAGGEVECMWMGGNRAIDEIIDSDSDDDGDDDMQNEKRVHIPIMMVGVKGIPKDCLVEIEVAALTQTLNITPNDTAPETDGTAAHGSGFEVLIRDCSGTSASIDNASSNEGNRSGMSEHVQVMDSHTDALLGVSYSMDDVTSWPLFRPLEVRRHLSQHNISTVETVTHSGNSESSGSKSEENSTIIRNGTPKNGRILLHPSLPSSADIPALQTIAAVELSECSNKVPGLKVRCSFRGYNRCVLAGIVHISMSATRGTDSMSVQSIQPQLMANVLTSSAYRVISEMECQPDDLRCMRLFLDNHDGSSCVGSGTGSNLDSQVSQTLNPTTGSKALWVQDVVDRLRIALCRHGTTSSAGNTCVVSALPVSSLPVYESENLTEKVELIVHISAVNLLQIETEKWVLQGR